MKESRVIFPTGQKLVSDSGNKGCAIVLDIRIENLLYYLFFYRNVSAALSFQNKV
jgi:hypothetical protein